MSEQFSRNPQHQKSLEHSLKDGVYFSAMTGAAEGYFSAFAIFLQSSTATVGMLASVPGLVAAPVQLLSVWLGTLVQRRKGIIVAGSCFQALLLLPIAALPFFADETAGVLLVALVCVYLVGPNLGAPHWNGLIGDLLPPARRGRFFARRTKLAAAASLGALIAAGLLLDVFAALKLAVWGFVAIFLIAAVLRTLSAYHLSKMVDPGRAPVGPLTVPTSLLQELRGSGLLRFSAFFACMQFAVALSGPYFSLYMLRELGLSYTEFMTLNAASVMVQLLTLSRWGRLSDLFGNRLILVTTSFVICVIPALWLVSTEFFWLLAVQMLSGFGWSGFTLSATASVFDRTPGRHRVALIAAHNTAAAVAIFLGAGLGALLVGFVPEQLKIGPLTMALASPLWGLFLLSFLLRVLVAAIFLTSIREVRRVRRMSVGGIIFRVTRMHPVSGVIYDIVGRTKPGREHNETGGENGFSKRFEIACCRGRKAHNPAAARKQFE